MHVLLLAMFVILVINNFALFHIFKPIFMIWLIFYHRLGSRSFDYAFPISFGSNDFILTFIIAPMFI
jgi:hypothetical protein